MLLPGTPDALTVHCFTDGPERDELVDDAASVGMGRAMARTLGLLGLGSLIAPAGLSDR